MWVRVGGARLFFLLQIVSGSGIFRVVVVVVLSFYEHFGSEFVNIGLCGQVVCRVVVGGGVRQQRQH